MAKNDNLSYSEAITEIEAILSRLDGGTPDVDTLAKEVKRATELIALCRSRLRKTEQELDDILKDK